MRRYLLCLSILAFTYPLASAQVFETEILLKSGQNDKRINLVFLPDSYQTQELSKFKAYVQRIVTSLFATSPFEEYKNYFNVHMIKVS